MVESEPPAYQSPLKIAQRKFLLLGVALALAIGGGLAVMNHFVREENKFHEAAQELAYKIKPAAPVKPEGSATQPAAPTTTGSAAPTMSVPPPQ